MLDSNKSKENLQEDESAHKGQEPTLRERGIKTLKGWGQRCKTFCVEHKGEILGSIAAAILLFALKEESDKQALRWERDKTRAQRDEAIKNYEIEREVTEMLADRVVNLEERHAEKDEWVDALASDDLRRGGSLGGKILNDKKQYLKGR